MRSLFLLILTLMVFTVPALGQEPTEKELMGLKGEVKTVRTKVVEVAQDGRPVEGPGILESLVTLDRLGRKTEESFYKADGTLDRRQVVTYDDAGNRTLKDYGADGKLKYEVTSRLESDKANGTGRLIIDGATSLFQGEAGKLHNEIVLKYDSRGRVVESLSYNRDGSLSSRSVNKFGDDGGLEEMILYNSAGVILQRHVRTSEGMQVYVYKDDGTLLTTELRRKPTRTDFDSHGNWTRETLTMTVNEGGRVEELTRVTYRNIAYY